jgi:hypothetical protein
MRPIVKDSLLSNVRSSGIVFTFELLSFLGNANLRITVPGRFLQVQFIIPAGTKVVARPERCNLPLWNKGYAHSDAEITLRLVGIRTNLVVPLRRRMREPRGAGRCESAALVQN